MWSIFLTDEKVPDPYILKIKIKIYTRFFHALSITCMKTSVMNNIYAASAMDSKTLYFSVSTLLLYARWPRDNTEQRRIGDISSINNIIFIFTILCECHIYK